MPPQTGWSRWNPCWGLSHSWQAAASLRPGGQDAVQQQGRRQPLGTPQGLYGAPANRFVASFLGPSAIKLLSAGSGRQLAALRC
jgi:ABC-type sugar transport system ATPase subunit